jgi:hypothetical protein
VTVIASTPDIKSAWLHAYMGMLDDRPGFIDHYQRNIIHSFGNKLTARSAVFDFDLGEIGLTITKWTKFTNQYVDIPLLHAWVNNAMNVKSYDALFPFKVVPPNFSGRKAVHQWGSCILGVSFRRNPKPSTLTFFTRAQSLGFSGVADYALCDFIARKLAERMGVEQSSIRLVVYCSNFIIKMVEVLHTLKRWELLDQYAEADNRIGESIRYYLRYMDNDAPELKWRAANRMRTKVRMVDAGYIRSLPVKDLTLRGWEYTGRTAEKKTLRETQSLILAGRELRKDEDGTRPELIIPSISTTGTDFEQLPLDLAIGDLGYAGEGAAGN